LLTINGSGFQGGATLTFVDPQLNSIPSIATKLTFISGGQINYQFNNLGDVGIWKVTVNNPDAQRSNALSFTVTPVTPPPAISGVSPATVPALNGNQLLTINGSGFQSGATLTFVDPQLNSIPSVATKLTFISGGQINYQFNNLSDVGIWKVTVNNPDAQHSNVANFTVK